MEHYRFNYFRIFLLCFCLFVVGVTRSVAIGPETDRRILHQPLFPVSSPPPDDELPPPPPPPPPPDSSHPFFPEVPSDPNGTPPPPVRSTNNGSIPIPASTQPGKPAKNVAIAISVGVVTLGMLSGLAFFLYRHRTKHPGESQKLVGATRRRLEDDPRVPPSNFLYIGTVEPSSRRSVSEENGPVESPYHKLNSVRISDRYRPSPELQPLPPLSKEPITNPLSTMSSSDEESHESAFYTPQGSSVSNEENCFSVSGQNYAAGKICSGSSSIPHSKRTSPRSRLSASSPDSKLSTMKPLMRQTQTPPPPPPPVTGFKVQDNQRSVFLGPSKPRFSAPPPPPNMTRLQSIGDSSLLTTSTPTPPPPPPPPPSLKLGAVETSKTSASSHTSLKQDSHGYNSKFTPLSEASKSIENTSGRDYSVEPADLDELEGGRPKLKPLHWDKVRATSDRATVWDRLKSSSFKLNEDMMESLFGCNSANMVSKEGNRRSVRPPVDQENRVLDPKKSQNIAILLRALNVTKEEVSEALLDGNPEALGAELFETLVKMAPTREEEIKLCNYNGDISKLGSAERFLKKVLDIPSAFKRVEAMLYRANFDAEVAYLRKCFQTLEDASEELKNSRLFLKLLEAVLQTGNRMNVGTNRGDARAFKLDTLLKLVDVKGTDGKTTLLHFVVQEIIRSEGGASPNPTNENAQKQKDNSKFEEDFKKQGLQVVSGLGRDLNNVKSAAGMDSDVLHGYVSKLETGLEKARSVLKYEQPSIQGKFFESMKLFLRDAEEDMNMIKGEERRALSMVKEVTEYFHGNAAKEEAHPFRIFMIVRDFLSVLDHVCKEVRSMQDKTMVGSARSFRISANSSLPVLNRYNATRNSSSDDYSLSP